MCVCVYVYDMCYIKQTHASQLYCTFDICMNLKYAGTARNDVVAQASMLTEIDDKIITFIDADDIMHHNRIEILSKIFQTNPDCMMILHYFRENEIPQADEIIYDNMDLVPYVFDQRCHFGHGTFREQVFEKVKYSAKPRGQDVEFVHNMLEYFSDKMYIYKQPLTVYNSNNSTFWKK